VKPGVGLPEVMQEGECRNTGDPDVAEIGHSCEGGKMSARHRMVQEASAQAATSRQ
jgi:hypothetical protein